MAPCLAEDEKRIRKTDQLVIPQTDLTIGGSEIVTGEEADLAIRPDLTQRQLRNLHPRRN
jgi:hypothetical protein